MRGKLNQEALPPSGGRIIPAHAGQTVGSARRAESVADHPRACGANIGGAAKSAGESGSSPRMRGKHEFDLPQHDQRRIIPAHAGQTVRGFGRVEHGADHPRACGANYQRASRSTMVFGSSPRMRGKHHQRGHGPATDRIIPAHAGQTAPSHWTRSRTADHPRACGANRITDTTMVNHEGSSPRMRGKLVDAPAELGVLRIIPAHAGQTCATSKDGSVGSDHPRACGANRVEFTDIELRYGSSPRMRGKPKSTSALTGLFRIIPAHAGQTLARGWCIVSRKDHPRACGANTSTIHIDVPKNGSSPRMRGKQLAKNLLPFPARIIPAHAGQTLCLPRKP